MDFGNALHHESEQSPNNGFRASGGPKRKRVDNIDLWLLLPSGMGWR